MGRRHAKTRRNPRPNPRGVLQATAAGYGFAKTPEGDYFIPLSKMSGAFDGDYVEVVPLKSNAGGGGRGRGKGAQGKPQARVVRVVQRAHETLVGRYEVADPFGVVVPLDAHIPYDVFTKRSDNPDIPDGAIVRVRMSSYPTRREAATGVVEEVLGFDGEQGVDVDVEMVIGRHQLETVFSQASLDQACAARVDVDGALEDGYRDIRSRFVFTIDPEDARDFDDAVSMQRLDGGKWRLGVHIADVSHYVPWDCSVDLDARRRATSVYLADRVLPMLPEALSGDVCSLMPKRPRRAITLDAVVDSRGNVLGYEFYRSVIESKARMSYDRAQCFLDASLAERTWEEARCSASELPEPAGALPLDDDTCRELFLELRQLHELARAREQLRKKAGGIDFQTVEAKVQLDDSGAPVAVRLRQKTPATSLVEEAMLLANECAARRLLQQGVPALFRVHDAPLPDDLAQVVPILREFGYAGEVDLASFQQGDPPAVQAVLARATGRPEARLVTQLTLRCMQRAVYRESCCGHYALALDAYCHFTSPIRRYPDLVAHRALCSALPGGEALSGDAASSLEWLARHCSKMERVAEEAARQTQELKIVEYMRAFVGRSFPGIVVGVAEYGIYVQLENTAEGLVRVEELGAERFSYDGAMHRLTGRESGREFRLGERLRVIVKDAPAHQRRLVLQLEAK